MALDNNLLLDNNSADTLVSVIPFGVIGYVFSPPSPLLSFAKGRITIYLICKLPDLVALTLLLLVFTDTFGI